MTGAVYAAVLPVPVMVPTALLPPAMPFTVQTTEESVVPDMVTVKTAVVPVCRVVEVGLKAITAGA